MTQYKTNFLTIFLTTIMLSVVVVGCSDDSTGSDTGASFDSGLLSTGESFSYTFEEEGVYNYYCQNHEPDMTGNITVTNSAESASQDTVRMQDLAFTPSQITVSPNTTIIWVNDDEVQHTVTSGSPSENDGGGY